MLRFQGSGRGRNINYIATTSVYEICSRSHLKKGESAMTQTSMIMGRVQSLKMIDYCICNYFHQRRSQIIFLSTCCLTRANSASPIMPFVDASAGTCRETKSAFWSRRESDGACFAIPSASLEREYQGH